MDCKDADKCEKSQNVQFGAIIAVDRGLAQLITPLAFGTYASL
jgi:hypothetical protein